MAAAKHIEVPAWLTALGLQEYSPCFQKYRGVEDMLMLTEADIKDLGVKISAHRARMVSSLVMLRDKLHKKTGAKPNWTTKSPSPPSFANHTDYGDQNLYQSPIYALNRGPSYHADSNDVADINSHPWFHGCISRQKAEKLVVREGDFLVRDSISQPGDFVLTCCHRGGAMHFVVNKQYRMDPGGTQHVLYQFEEQLFDTVPELIQYYMATQKPISEASGASINNSVARHMPLNYNTNPTAGRNTSPNLHRRSHSQGPPTRGGGPQLSLVPTSSPSPTLQRKPRRTGSQPLLSMDDDHDQEGNIMESSFSGSLPDIAGTAAGTVTVADRCHTCPRGGGNSLSVNTRVGSEPSLSPKGSPKPFRKLTNMFGTLKTALSTSGSDGELSKPPPPKPSRVPTIKRGGKDKPVVKIRNQALYEDDGKDYSDYDQIKTWPSAAHKNLTLDTQSLSKAESKSKKMDQNELLAQARQSHNDRNNSQMMGNEDYDVPKTPKIRDISQDSLNSNLDDGPDLVPTKLSKCTLAIPNLNIVSDFHLGRFESAFLPPENKPLDNSSMVTVKAFLLEGNPQHIAQHITCLDLMLLRVMGEHDLGVCVGSGLEAITLPQGKNFRMDALERYHCMKLFVAVTVLTCSRPAERAQMIHCWVQIAQQLRGIMGNLFGFSAVMQGLMLSPVARLKNTWIALRQTYSNTAFMFEAKLFPLLRSMDEASSILPLQNITIPHIVPLLQLLERTVDDTSLLSWESSSVDAGLDIMLAHLDTARIITEQCGLYRVTAENIMRGFRPIREVLEMFRTELHLKLLWGARGAAVNQQDRYSKFDLLLEVLSQRVEPSQFDPETSL